MLFTQIEFIFFLLVVFLLLMALRKHEHQKLMLLCASYYFYGYWDWRFLLLVFACTCVNYYAAQLIAGSESRSSRKALLLVALCFSLGTLGFFKYWNFFTTNLNLLLSTTGAHAPVLSIILPVGISFFTFQTLSYTIDVYRRKIMPCNSFRDFALYVSFFPQIMAGPIVRASNFLPQLQTPRSLSWARAYGGFEQFVYGFFKKVFIADRLASFVDYSFANAAVFDGCTLWLAAAAYSIQIYCDFSGYSDMAIGIARAMGYDYEKNFDLPYLAKSVEDFWRRWHISLSSWLRDYLYIPLGGNRKGTYRTYCNLMLTMVLGGLWHGASWTFIIWGVWHGGALCLHKWYRSLSWGTYGKRMQGAAYTLLCHGATLLIVIVGWVFFRADNLSNALSILHRMFAFQEGIVWPYPFAIAVVVVMFVYHVLRAIPRVNGILDLRPDTLFAPAVLLFMLGLALIFRPAEFRPFIYFQF